MYDEINNHNLGSNYVEGNHYSLISLINSLNMNDINSNKNLN